MIIIPMSITREVNISRRMRLLIKYRYLSGKVRLSRSVSRQGQPKNFPGRLNFASMRGMMLYITSMRTLLTVMDMRGENTASPGFGGMKGNIGLTWKAKRQVRMRRITGNTDTRLYRRIQRFFARDVYNKISG